MQVEKRDSAQERRILIGFIVDGSVLARIAPIWSGDNFRSKWSNLLGKWCTDHYSRYQQAPGRQIESIFEAWAGNGQKNKETVDMVDRFLGSLGREYEQLKEQSNSDYLVDLASRHFNAVKLERLRDEINSNLTQGHVDKALQLVNSFGAVQIGTDAGVDVMHDDNAWIDAFAEQRESLIQLPDEHGEFFGSALQRDAFIGLMGPEKRGKTMHLLDQGWRAMEQRKRVAFFEVGDMSRNQIMRRFAIRAARRPLKAGTIKLPRSLTIRAGENEEERAAMVEFEERRFDGKLGWREAVKARDRVVKNRIRSNDPYLMLACYPNSTISVQGITGVLDGWERQFGWSPDLLVIDYADILAPLNPKQDRLHQIEDTWRALRALSQFRHCLVITATQTKAESARAHTIRRWHTADNKLKLAHVTGMVGISQTTEEKDNQVMRLNWVVLREEDYRESKCVYLAGCLGIANPAILSAY